jgi:predicted Zn-dependent protease
LWEGYDYSTRGRIEDARRRYEKGLAHFPNSVALQSSMGRLLLDLDNYVDARNLFVQLQKKTDLKPADAIHLLNNIAIADVKMGTRELLDEADTFSKTACEKMPWQAEFKWTRALVLVEKGNIDQGLALLREAMEKSESSDHKAIYASYIAEIENKKGNTSE